MPKALIQRHSSRMTRVIQHSAHEHPLTLLWDDETSSCSGCGDQIYGYARYNCTECNSFCLHTECAELPWKIDRPAHPETPLILRLRSENCSGCRKHSCPIYICGNNLFFLCEICASLPETIEHTSHQHQLHLQLKASCFTCDACDRSEEGLSYHCASCAFGISDHCSLLPTILEPTSHHSHPLTLVGAFRLDKQLSKFQMYCDLCFQEFKKSNCVYYCAECTYYAHIGCATTSLNGNKATDHRLPKRKTRKNKAKEAQEIIAKKVEDDWTNTTVVYMPTPDISGYHDMVSQLIGQMSLKGSNKSGRGLNQCIFCEQHYTVIDEPSDEICDACILPISAPCYNCPNCHLILHKSCAELPGEIHHPLHTQHPLTLLNPRLFECSACDSYCTGLAFHCAICSFYLDIKCSSSPTIIKHEAHEHPLKYQIHSNSICIACYKSVNYPGGYACANCNFNLHMRCALLPRTLTHVKYDNHALTLTYTPVRTISNEYYCELCKNALNPKLWFYYSRDFNYSFDPSCICKVAQIIYWNAKVGIKIIVDQHPCPLTSVLKGKHERSLYDKLGFRQSNIAFECKKCDFEIDIFSALHLLRRRVDTLK